MTRRVNIQYIGPGPHRPDDFIDIIHDHIRSAAPQVKGGVLCLSAEAREFSFIRDGKRFNGLVMDAIGHITVIVQEDGG